MNNNICHRYIYIKAKISCERARVSVKWRLLWLALLFKPSSFFFFCLQVITPHLLLLLTPLSQLTIVRLFFFTLKFYLGTTYLFSNTTNKLLSFPKYFLLYYYVNHKCFISHNLNWVMI